MGKFKVHLKLQGLELDIEGDRSDMPAINNAVVREITGLIQPAAALTNGAEPPATLATIEGETDNGKKPRPRKKPSASRSSGDTNGQAIDFRHDSAQYAIHHKAGA